MYLKEVQSIHEAEEAARHAKAAALAEAKALVAEAEKNGQALLSETVSRAEEETKGLLLSAAEKASEKRTVIEKNTSDLQETIRAGAAARLNKAAQLIVERIVNSR